ncbi:hypothetical protein OW944_17650, partial [Klebsiella pneumoniae]
IFDYRLTLRHINKKVIFTLKIACSASYVLMIKTILIIIDYRTFFSFFVGYGPRRNCLQASGKFFFG